ncbi:MAG: carbohydrate ABC transporter permease [Chloroflexi bacterium]|nr:carbohydrate ABC transporter permease [Chloroflexota bacterium]
MSAQPARALPVRPVVRQTAISTIVRRTIGRGLLHLLIIAVCWIMVFPVLWTVSTSFKLEPDIMRYPPVWIPNPATLEGYRSVVEDGRLFRYITNTFILSGTSMVITVLVASLAGYAFSRFRFAGRDLILLFILATVLIPGLTQLIPLYQMIKVMGLLNTYQGLIIIYAAHGLPFTIWILKSFFDAVPIELEEAAMIDGCTPVQALARVILPISAPGLMAASVLNFVGHWNEFLTALVFTSKDEMRNVSVGLYNYLGWYGSVYNRISAAALLVIVPVLILFFIGRKNFVQGMVEGALKG